MTVAAAHAAEETPGADVHAEQPVREDTARRVADVLSTGDADAMAKAITSNDTHMVAAALAANETNLIATAIAVNETNLMTAVKADHEVENLSSDQDSPITTGPRPLVKVYWDNGARWMTTAPRPSGWNRPGQRGLF